MQTFTLEVQLTSITCCSCGGAYALAEDYRRTKYQEKGGWHCPYCRQSQGYWEGENDKLRRQLAQATAACDQVKAAAADAARAAANAAAREDRAKRESKRLKTWAANGVCPCCHRQFQNMARHMKTKHPELLQKA